MHEILENFYLNKILKDGLTSYYLCNFHAQVVGSAPSSDVFLGFFNEGFEYLKNIENPSGEILAVELRVDFEIAGYKFTGFVDLVIKMNDQTIEIWDHKSHPLKPRSSRAKPTKADQELDEYLRQLYLYAIPVCKKFGVLPNKLVFNCYRKGVLVKEPFRADRMEEAKQWALSLIKRIEEDRSFRPNLDYFSCRYLCEVSDSCEYRRLSSGRVD